MKRFNKKKQVVFLSVMILLIITVLSTGSYAWFVITDDSNKEIVIKAGQLELTYTDNNNDFTLANNTPISYNDAKSVSGHSFTITNSGSLSSDYDVYLEDATLGNGETRIPDANVRYILKDGSGTEISNGLITSLTNNKLVSGTLTNHDDSVTYELILFLDEDAFTSSVVEKTFKKSIRISAVQHDK